jgi:hypothetical protein
MFCGNRQRQQDVDNAAWSGVLYSMHIVTSFSSHSHLTQLELLFVSEMDEPDPRPDRRNEVTGNPMLECYS